LAETRLKALGVVLRPLELSRWESELREVHRISTASFAGALLYQPLSEAEFVAEWEPFRSFVEPELVQFAVHGGRAVGFVFGVPDLLQGQRHTPMDTLILKTLGVIPDRAYAGLGRYLTQHTHRQAARHGYRRVIHALMHEGNASLNISARYARIFRRYTVWAQSL
jgi:GNAT superfamily N-acetyltransferase